MALLESCLAYLGILMLVAILCTKCLYRHDSKHRYCKSKARLDGKTVIITGCTSGIGEATAMDLAKRGARIIMACRNLHKANKVRQHIIEESGNKDIVVKILDVGLLSSVRKFAEEINATEKRLDVLIHNAGTGLYEEFTEEGFNVVWATNHFGPFLLTNLLIDLLKRTKNSRIINVSSRIHAIGNVDLNNPNPKNGSLFHYPSSKLASMIVANELARRLKDSGVTVNSLHPGLIGTAINLQGPLFWRCYTTLTKPMQKTVEQGAQTTIYLAVSEEVKGVTGRYFANCKEVQAAKKTQDIELARNYWTICEKVVGLAPSKSQETGQKK